MTRAGQYCCVITALVLCLALVLYSMGGVSTTARADARPGNESRLPTRIEDVEAALERLLSAGRQYGLTGGALERQRFAHLLSRLDQASAAVGRGGAEPEGSERLQLLEAVRHMLPRIHDLGREIVAQPDVRSARATSLKVGALVRLGDKTLAALGQLRATPAPSETTPATVGAHAGASVVPEGVAVLLVTILCAISMALVSAARRLDLARRR